MIYIRRGIMQGHPPLPLRGEAIPHQEGIAANLVETAPQGPPLGAALDLLGT